MMVYSVLIVCCVTVIFCCGEMRKLGNLQVADRSQEFTGRFAQKDVMECGERVHLETSVGINHLENNGYDTMTYGQRGTELDTNHSPIPTTVDPIEKIMPYSTKNESDCFDAFSLSTLCTASIDNDKSMHDLFNSVCSSLDTDCRENSILTPESTIQEYQDFTEENLCSQTYALNDLSQVSHVDTNCGDYNFNSNDGFGSQNTPNDICTTTISDSPDQSVHYDQYECMFSDFISGDSNSQSRDIITPVSAISQVADFNTKDTCEASKIDDVVNSAKDSEKVEYLCLPFFSFELYNAMNIFDKLYSTEPRYVSTNHIYLNDGWVQSRSTLSSPETYNSYIYNCIIKLDRSNINYILTGRSREQLYAKVKDPLNNSSMYYIDNRKLNHTKYNTCIFKFIWNLDVENYSYQNVQELYITFIAYIFLDYNDNLKCYVMKDFLWDIHTYMTELYFIIMWRLGRLNLEMTDQQSELQYKTNLHREMKHLCAIVRLYNDIKKLDNQAVDYPKQTSALYFEVDRFRMHILSYLETIYPTDGASTLYYFGYHMRKYNIGQKYLARDVNAKLIPKKLAGQQNQPGVQKRKSELRKRIGGRTNPKYFKYFHHKNLTKYTIYILAFTINFASFTQHQYDINTIKEQAKNMNNKDSITKILYTEFTGDDRNREQINNVIINIIRFLGLVRNKSVVVQGRIAMTDDNISRVLFELDKMINTTRPSKIQEGRRLALYRKYILEAMGICND